jgi:ribonuclease P protein component
MTRAAEFSSTIRRGVRAAQPDIVVHVRRDPASEDAIGPQIGLVVAKSVGNAVQRHRVSRQLRHIARGILCDLPTHERVVIRALPGSRDAASSGLERQLRAGLRRAHDVMERKGESR